MPDEFRKQSQRIFDAKIANIDATIINIQYSSEMGFASRILSFILFAFFASLVAIRQNANVIYATSTPLSIAIPAIVGKLWNRVPMVFEVRDLWPDIPIAIGAIRNPLLIWSARLLEQMAYKHSARVIALSPGMKQGIVRAGYPSEQVHVLPNSCDVELFSVSTDAGVQFRSSFEWLGDRPLVVYAGSIGLINGVGYLAHLAHRVYKIAPEVRFLIIGRGGYEEKNVHALAEELGVLNINFFMIPQIPKNQMPAALSAATISTSVVINCPALYNNSANKFFDSLASGTPIAINHEGWQADLLRESGAGIVLHPTDYDMAAEGLLTFLNSDAQLRKSSLSALSLAKNQYDRNSMAHKLETILSEVVDEYSR